jgi:uncharacterized protein DUF3857
LRLHLSFHALLRAFALSFLLASLNTAFAQAQQAPQKPSEKPIASVATPSEPPNPAQFELLETKFRFEANGDSRKEVHARVRINSELGVRQFARLNFDYNRSFQSIDVPLVHITHPTGGTTDILPSAITDNPNPAVVNAPAYQDVRVKSVRILGLEPGDNLEYRVITTTTHHPLAPDFWLDHSFDRTGVVSQEMFELDLPAPMNLTTKMGTNAIPRPIIYVNSGSAFYNFATEEDSTRFVYRWEIVPSRKLTPATDDDGAPVPDVIVTSFRFWPDLQASLSDMLTNWSQDDRVAAKSRLGSLGPEAISSYDKLRESYEFVSRLVTVDLPLGATGYRHRTVREILESSYATSEEKCFLLTLMANLAGSHADIVVAGAPETLRQFPRPSALSRVFVVITEKDKPRRYIGLDPTLEVAPFGVIPADFRGREALRLVPDNDGWPGRDFDSLKLPLQLPFRATQQVAVTASIDSNGTLSAKVKYALRGNNELLLRLAFHQSPKDKWKELAQLLSLSDGFRGQVTSVTASDPYATREPFTVDYEITQSKFVDWSKKPVRIPALLPQLGLPDPPAKPAPGSATAPIELGTPLEVDTKMTLRLPPGTDVAAPTGTSVQRDYATFASQYSIKGLTITASRHINFLLRQVPADRAADYNAFLRAVLSDQAQDFTLDREPAAAPATAPPSTPKP